jgi:hypothetical protein
MPAVMNRYHIWSTSDLFLAGLNLFNNWLKTSHKVN